MTFDDFTPFIAPYCRNTATVAIEHHIKLSAVEFCGRTGVLTRELDPIRADGLAGEFALDLGTDEEVVRLHQVYLDSEPYLLLPEWSAIKRIREQSRSRFAYLVDRRTLIVSPVPEDGRLLYVTAIVKPTLGALSRLPDELEPHLQDIAHGALSGLLAIPGPDQNLAMATMNRQMFDGRIATVATSVDTGFIGRVQKAMVVAR